MTRLELHGAHGYRLDGQSVPGATTVLNALAKPALVGWAAGVHDAGADATEIGAGGRRSPGGAVLTTDTICAIASCTKPIGGVLALRLVELGILDIDGRQPPSHRDVLGAPPTFSAAVVG